jgi:hypothetical protein
VAYPVAETGESLHFIIVDHDVEVVVLSPVLEVEVVIVCVVVLVSALNLGVVVDIVIVWIFLEDIFQLALILSLETLVHEVNAHVLGLLALEQIGRTLEETSSANFHLTSVIAFLEVRHGNLLLWSGGQKRQREQGIVETFALALALLGWQLADGVDAESLDDEGTGVGAVFEA